MPTSVRKAVPLGQDPLVGGRHVGVGAEHGAHPAVEVEAHRLLLAGRLGVEVDHDHLDSRVELAAAARSAVRNGESRLLMKTMPLEVDHRHRDAGRRLPDVEPVPGVALRVVGGAQEARLALEQIASPSFLSQMWLPVV